ncbi:MAG: NAD(+) synthase [Candidatus Acidiferrum sp.]|jgi:NAD+ synthase/NAD+ synthase (glutamine-hydrolysing)
MKIALAQFNPTVGDFDGNSARILELATQAKNRGADLAVFSELCICGYLPLDLLERPAFIQRNLDTLKRVASRMPLPAIVGYAGRVNPDHHKTGKSIANKAALICDGRVVFEQSKMLLPTYDVFDESRYFRPGDKQYVYGLDREQIGITICEDVWNDKTFWATPMYARDPVSELVSQGSSVLINISASPFTIVKRHLRLGMLRSTALHHKRPVVYVNQVGGNDSLIFDGASVAFDANGKIAAQAKAFEDDIVLFDTVTGKGDIHEQPVDEIAYSYQALVLGTRDYVRKCNFSKAIVGLSGGVDSAVVAAIAVDALGASNVLGVSMPGPYSSEGSKSDAQALAGNLGIEFLTIPITYVFESYREALAAAFGLVEAHSGHLADMECSPSELRVNRTAAEQRPASPRASGQAEGGPNKGVASDATEENIQARIRGNYLMALSNRFGSMVLSTGNKSENAVGYCTLYGDMAGGLAVISDVPKLMVYNLARHINREREVIPRSTLEKPPSAELRPNQKDTDSLPPYEVLDRILKSYIEEVKSPEEIAVETGFDLGLVRNIAALVDRNEYKRKQAAPGLKITSRAFGFGRPFPIAQRFVP